MPKKITSKEIKSPYSAAFTAASMMYSEMNALIPLFQDEHAQELINKEIEENNLLCINSLMSRKRVVSELQRRYHAVPRSFWDQYLLLNEKVQRIALFFVLLKTYQLLFDMHVCMTLSMWRSADIHLESSDVMLYLNELASQDKFVDSWTESTRKKVCSVYILMLHQAGLMQDGTAQLQEPSLSDEDWLLFIRIGEPWFIEACFLPTYRIRELKQKAK
jgi:hypothetical protein